MRGGCLWWRAGVAVPAILVAGACGSGASATHGDGAVDRRPPGADGSAGTSGGAGAGGGGLDGGAAGQATGNDGASPAGDAPGDLPTLGGVADFSGTWEAVEVAGPLATGSQAACKKTVFTITQTATRVTVAERSFSCTAGATPSMVTFPERVLDVAGGELRLDGMAVGTIDGAALMMHFCATPTLCADLTLRRVTADRVSYGESAQGGANLMGTLYRQGSYVAGKLECLSGAMADLGNIALGSTKSQTLTFQNTGQEVAKAISVTGIANGFSRAGGTCAATLDPGATCTVTVQATAMAFGDFTSKVTVDYHSVGDAYQTQVVLKAAGPALTTDSRGSGTDNYSLGNSVAIEGSSAIVGAPRYGPNDDGRAYFYQLQGTKWTMAQEITDAAVGYADYFGWGVALSGTNAAIDAPLGAGLFFFKFDGTKWVFRQRPVVPTSIFDGTRTIAMSKDTAVIASPANAVLIILRDDGTNWAEQTRLTTGGFGRGVALSGDWMAAPATDGVHLFHLETGTWTDKQTIPGTATSVALSPGRLAIGQRGMSVAALYRFDDTGGTWVADGSLSDPAKQSAFYFGEAVAIDADLVLVGAPHFGFFGSQLQGNVYLSRRGAAAWGGLAELNVHASTNGLYGTAMAISGDWAVVGAPGASTVYFFTIR